MSTAITLFGLVTKRNDTRPIFSSFVGPYDLQRLTAELNILGVTYKAVNKSFSEIRYLFEEVKNPNVAIATITIKVGDEYIRGSWKIAQWANGRLSRNRLHPLESLLKYHDEVGKKLFTNNTLATHADSTLLDGMPIRGLMRAGGKDGGMRSYHV
ncbi:hypothetical protein D1P53_001727 [Cryptococcus gattii VGV]|nr:hypothetical protein D1P53_001727 [Cryptococcus gattii VGV]